MSARRGDRRLTLLAFAWLALYVLFLSASPFEHHDLVCHLKTPQHCTSCSGSPLGSDPHALVLPGNWQLADAGSAFASEMRAETALLAIPSTGRSPPAVL
jgi:hypothetical protein